MPCTSSSIASISVALPRVRDFKGVSTKSFDGRGNYTLGLRDQLIFAGDRLFSKVDKIKGNERHDRDNRRRMIMARVPC